MGAIAGIRSATQESVGAIKEISAIVERLSEISSTIAAAVEEQGAAPWRSTNSATWKAVSSSLRDASSNCNPQNERKTIGIRVDATEAGAKSQDFDIPIADWFFHPNDEIDLAAVSVSIDVLKSKGLETAFSSNDEMALTKSQMADVCVSAGSPLIRVTYHQVQLRQCQCALETEAQPILEHELHRSSLFRWTHCLRLRQASRPGVDQ